MNTDAARAAAQQLPPARLFDGNNPGKARARIRWIILLAIAVPAAFAIVFAVTLPMGWLAALIAIPLGIGLWALWSLILPRYRIAVVAATPDGNVTVLSGRSMIRVYQRMHARGVRRWYTGGLLIGALTVVLAIIAAITATALLPADLEPLPVPTLLLASACGIAAAVSSSLYTQLRASRSGSRMLDARVIMPLLGLFAVQHGTPAALAGAGIPADKLIATRTDATAEQHAVLLQQFVLLGAPPQFALGDSMA